jgi:hypothetical protein
MNLIRSMAVLAFIAVCLLACASCGGNGPALHPVRGKVLVDGRPAAGATVVFQPVQDSAEALKPSGRVGDDGTFRLDSYPHGQGAPAGEYIVLVTWFAADPRDPDNLKNKLPARYGERDKTPLPRTTVKNGSNDLNPFNLSAK